MLQSRCMPRSCAVHHAAVRVHDCTGDGASRLESGCGSAQVRVLAPAEVEAQLRMAVEEIVRTPAAFLQARPILALLHLCGCYFRMI